MMSEVDIEILWVGLKKVDADGEEQRFGIRIPLEKEH